MDTTICFLAANKCDSEAREVDEVEARLWAELHGFIYCETSANTGLGITDMFQVSLVIIEIVIIIILSLSGILLTNCPPGRVRDGIKNTKVRKAAGKRTIETF